MSGIIIYMNYKKKKITRDKIRDTIYLRFSHALDK